MSFDAPDPPDYGAASREAVEAEIANLPARYNAELQYRPKFAEQDAAAAALTARKMAEAMLSIEQEYGSQFTEEALKRLEEADPGSTQVRRDLIKVAQQKLENPGKLSGEVLRETVNATRNAQTARGNYLGDGAAFIEAQNVGDAAYRRELADLSTASSILAGQTPQAQFGQISQAGAGAVPFTPLQTPPVVNPNAAAQGASFAASTYGSQAAARGNPWMEILGTVGGIAAGKWI